MPSILSLLSFFVGGVLLLVVATTLSALKSNFKANFFFITILVIAGVQRVLFGLEEMGFIRPSVNPFTQTLVFAFLIPPINYFFFRGLLFKKSAWKPVLFHFGFSLLLVSLIWGFDSPRILNRLLFFGYSTTYFVSLLYMIYTYISKRKNQREVQHFKRVRMWTFLMLAVITCTYFFSNFFYGQGLELTFKEISRKFYEFTSLFWLCIAYYLIKNPRILFGESRFIEQIAKVLPEEIPIWKSKRSGTTSVQDVGVEKQVEGKVVELIFSLKKLEEKWSTELLEVPTVKSLSFHLECPQSHVKYIFKYYGNYTFGEYVNVLKVNYAIRLIRAGYLNSYTIDSLSQKVLFGSNNTFHLNFKKLTGESPSDYHSSHLGQGS